MKPKTFSSSFDKRDLLVVFHNCQHWCLIKNDDRNINEIFLQWLYGTFQDPTESPMSRIQTDWGVSRIPRGGRKSWWSEQSSPFLYFLVHFIYSFKVFSRYSQKVSSHICDRLRVMPPLPPLTPTSPCLHPMTVASPFPSATARWYTSQSICRRWRRHVTCHLLSRHQQQGGGWPGCSVGHCSPRHR